MTLTTIILTKDEARHIRRAIESIASVSNHVLVIDSGSTDDTIAIAESLGAKVIYNPWRNYATQFNFALDHLPSGTDWVLRLDADEIVSAELSDEISNRLGKLGSDVSGVYVSRRMSFLRRPIRWGGVFPIRVLRLFRAGKGRCEVRWMDEHILVEGTTASFHGEIMDDNLNSLSWWTEKHNAYASREVVDLLNQEYGFMKYETVANLHDGQQASMKRWIKENVYAKLPGGLRAATYFLYRYVIRLGVLDGREGAAFHILQGFWYRFLVDMKYHEVKCHMRSENVDVVTAIRDVLSIEVGSSSHVGMSKADNGTTN
jgi:glycosyltransferase involved in cell wall biosynthesis